MLRLGVIGAGWFVSRRHLPDAARCDDVQVAALCRRDLAPLRRVRDALAPEAALHRDWREMLDAGGLDAVLIATPHALHYEQASEALERGLHVLLEKPMAITSAEAHALAASAASRGLTLAVALNPPHWAHCHRMRALVREGALGEVESVSMLWTGNADYVFGDAPAPRGLPGVVPPTMYRADPSLCGGGYLMDGGPHLVSEVLWVTGQRAVEVACQMDSTPRDRRATVSLRLAAGALATISSVGNSRFGDRRVLNVFAGSAGTLRVEGFDFRVRCERAGAPVEEFTEAGLPAVAGPLRNFVDATLYGAELHSPAAHGVHVTEVLEAAYLSASEGRAVRLRT
ncbi:MAG TPA: Gfo/Idh/MocA family oxidoreductase [Chthonomonadales bacterium]|nr:Gfo/Idh/MocA family oxidoreductase [Chthonomonadales bacterium]